MKGVYSGSGRDQEDWRAQECHLIRAPCLPPRLTVSRVQHGVKVAGSCGLNHWRQRDVVDHAQVSEDEVHLAAGPRCAAREVVQGRVGTNAVIVELQVFKSESRTRETM